MKDARAFFIREACRGWQVPYMGYAELFAITVSMNFFIWNRGLDFGSCRGQAYEWLC